ncbi:hypothetical protein [Oscillibacter sp.]|uniref:hypothetical protein n=1 Tax=Oscillibacter sp. TaxID=1945593 RepID=UPI002638D18B|nr:hypothetical protein [Oscillibacter sp.]MDD3346732.1 hypothetical protein [Oscillibacter sp.]
MSNDPILSLLGLALRGSHLAVGEEPVESVARARDARVLLLAGDAADNTRRRIERFADAGQCIWIRVPFTKEQLGRAVGRASVAVVAVTDIGLAAALVRRLADRDPERYGESARRLDVKSQRAAERKSEMLAHEKNLREGRHKSKAAIPEEPKAPSRQEGAPARKYPPRRDGSPRQEGAPERKYPPRRDGAPRQEGAPARKYPPRRDGAPRQEVAPERKYPPRRDGAPRQEGAPERKFPPRRDGASRQEGAPERKYPPRRDGAPRQEGAPERKFPPRRDGSPAGGTLPGKPSFRKDGPKKDDRPRTPGASPYRGKSRPSKENRPKPRAKAPAYTKSHPVKKGKGSFRKKES